MGIEGFLKVPDIPGASVRHGHEGEIEVHGVTFSMAAPLDLATGTRRGRVAVDNIVFTKYYDMSSPYLKKALFDNTPMDEVVLSVRRTTDGMPSDYLVVTLNRASVTKYEMRPAEAEPEMIEERLGFTFQAIKFNYDDAHEVELNLRTTK
jgi:type VI secretion system secreted protein Hcp